MFSMKKDKEISVKKIKIKSGKRRNIPALVLSPKNGAKNATGILWIHGGGYFLGMKEMVHMSRAVDLVKKFGAVVISPAYTFVGDGEPFYCETLEYVENLKKCGIPANVDVYHCNIHAFDMLKPKLEVSKRAIANFLKEFAYAQEHYFAEQKDFKKKP